MIRLTQLAVAIAFSALSLGCRGPLPSDDALIGQFSAVRPDLETLAEMLEDDGVRSVHVVPQTDLLFFPSVVDEQRKEEYRRIIANCGIRDIARSSDRVEFVVAQSGWPHCLVRKGYLYATDFLPILHNNEDRVESLDRRSRSSGKAWRHFQADWYLFFEPCGGS